MAEFPPLVADETVVWDGRPLPGFHFSMGLMAMGIFAVAMLLASLGLATVIERARPGVYWTILGPGLLLAIVCVAVVPVLDRRKQRETRYRLTNKRAIIQIADKTNSYSIPEPERIKVRGDGPYTLTFGHDAKNQPLTFAHIADGPTVHKQMQAVAASLHGMTATAQSAKDTP